MNMMKYSLLLLLAIAMMLGAGCGGGGSSSGGGTGGANGSSGGTTSGSNGGTTGTTVPKSYIVRDLGTLPGGTYSFGRSINANGTVVGESDNGSATHAVSWQDGHIYDL